MYKLKVKDSIYTIPKENIRLLAMTKAMDLKQNVDLSTSEKAIEYLKSIGIKVYINNDNWPSGSICVSESE